MNARAVYFTIIGIAPTGMLLDALGLNLARPYTVLAVSIAYGCGVIAGVLAHRESKRTERSGWTRR